MAPVPSPVIQTTHLPLRRPSLGWRLPHPLPFRFSNSRTRRSSVLCAPVRAPNTLRRLAVTRVISGWKGAESLSRYRDSHPRAAARPHSPPPAIWKLFPGFTLTPAAQSARDSPTVLRYRQCCPMFLPARPPRQSATDCEDRMRHRLVGLFHSEFLLPLFRIPPVPRAMVSAASWAPEVASKAANFRFANESATARDGIKRDPAFCNVGCFIKSSAILISGNCTRAGLGMCVRGWSL